MNERLKLLRKNLKLTQEEFAKKIGIKRNTLANYEIGRNEPIDAVIFSICRVFNVNETWLRDGIGDIFSELIPEDEYTAAAAEISKSGDKLAMQAVIEYWKLDKESKKLLKNFILHIVENTKNKE